MSRAVEEAWLPPAGMDPRLWREDLAPELVLDVMRQLLADLEAEKRAGRGDRSR